MPSQTPDWQNSVVLDVFSQLEVGVPNPELYDSCQSQIRRSCGLVDIVVTHCGFSHLLGHDITDISLSRDELTL